MGIEVLAGDFTKGGSNSFSRGILTIFRPGKVFPEKIKGTQILEVVLGTEENVKKLAGTLGWGAAGAVLLGPLGAIAGALIGGNKKKVVFVCALTDGRKFLGECDQNTFKELTAQVFDNNIKKERGQSLTASPEKSTSSTIIKVLVVLALIYFITALFRGSPPT